MVTWGPVTSKTCQRVTKVDRELVYDKELLSSESRDLLVTWSHMAKNKKKLSLLPKSLWWRPLTVWWLLTRSTIKKSHDSLITWSHELMWQLKIYISPNQCDNWKFIYPQILEEVIWIWRTLSAECFRVLYLVLYCF